MHQPCRHGLGPAPWRYTATLAAGECECNEGTSCEDYLGKGDHSAYGLPVREPRRVDCPGGDRMKAIAVYPGQKNSAHLADLPMPSLDEIPNGRGVLVRLLRCGVDGTDKEINAAEYGAAPDGFDFLTIGHENFGRVEAIGPTVSEVQPGDYVVATVRRRGSSIYDQIGI